VVLSRSPFGTLNGKSAISRSSGCCLEVANFQSFVVEVRGGDGMGGGLCQGGVMEDSYGCVVLCVAASLRTISRVVVIHLNQP
jgi:hypothetical protein